MSKILTAFFSASGTTGKLAQRVAEAAGADVFEIVPEKPYSAADLRWTNPLARCNREKIGKKDVPIAGTVGNFGDYDLFLIGFPIWYYGAPNIIQTFVKQYDFSGKKIALFATSGGSDIGKTAAKLRPLLSESANIIDAKLFKASDSDEAIAAWVKTLTE
jgi:flavodoxin